MLKDCAKERQNTEVIGTYLTDGIFTKASQSIYMYSAFNFS
jgi:hypothetical protein